MAMVDAFRFLAVCRKDSSFRLQLYGYSGEEGFSTYLLGEGYNFSDSEIEDALRSLELRSVDEYEAEEIKQLGQWYSLMAMPERPSPCSACHKVRAT